MESPGPGARCAVGRDPALVLQRNVGVGAGRAVSVTAVLLSPLRLGDPHLVKAFIAGFLPAISSCLLVWSRDGLLEPVLGPSPGWHPCLPPLCRQAQPGAGCLQWGDADCSRSWGAVLGLMGCLVELCLEAGAGRPERSQVCSKGGLQVPPPGHSVLVPPGSQGPPSPPRAAGSLQGSPLCSALQPDPHSRAPPSA